eukprot:scaffold4936_cov73-Phaeocystis_antarctica.AAC.9
MLRRGAAPTALRRHSRGTVASDPAHRPAAQLCQALRPVAQPQVASSSPAPGLRTLVATAAAGAAAVSALLPAAEQRAKRPASATSRNRGSEECSTLA